MDRFKIKFKEEAEELIDRMEKSLLLMESNPDDPALIEEIFRNMHTLKGNSSMFGFKIIADFTHLLESIYDLMHNGDVKISKQILNVTFSALDHLSLLLNNKSLLNDEEKKSHDQLSEKIIEIVNSINKNTENNGLAKSNNNLTSVGPVNELTAYHIYFSPDTNFFLNGNNPLNLINELHELGQCKVIVHIDNIPVLEDCDPDTCYTSWDIYLRTKVDLKLIRDVFLFVESICKLEINEIIENDSFLNQHTAVNNSSGTYHKPEELNMIPRLMPSLNGQLPQAIKNR